MLRVLALIVALAAGMSAAEARQPLFLLSVVSPTTDPGAFTIDVAPLGRSCGPHEAAAASCFYAVDPGQQLTLSVTLAPGYTVAQWTGLCAGNAPSVTVTIPAEGINGCGLRLAYDIKAAVTGWWWVPEEGGRGYSLALNDEGRVFIAAYGYDETGAPRWRSGTLTRAETSGTLTFFRGTIAEYRGGGTLAGGEAGSAAPSGRHWTALLALTSRAGIVSLLSLTDNVDGAVTTKRIQRFPIDDGSIRPAPAEAAPAGWYYDPDQPGVGYFVEQQGARAFLSAFTYDAAGAPVWYVMGGAVVPGGAGWLMEGDITAYHGGSPFAASPPLAVPHAVPAGRVSAGLSPAGVVLQLSSGRRIVLSRYAW